MAENMQQNQEGSKEPENAQSQEPKAEPQEPKAEPQEPKAEPQAEPKEEGLIDSHGQKGVSKERADREIAKRDKQIEELRAKVEEAAKSEEERKKLYAEIENLKKENADKDLTMQLKQAGCKSDARVKAAKTLLADNENDIDKLKENEPWLFEQAIQGSTGGKPVAKAGDDIDSILDKAMHLV